MASLSRHPPASNHHDDDDDDDSLSTASTDSDDSLAPTPMTSKQLEERRSKALRLFRSGFVIDADSRPADAIAMDATRQGLKSMYTMSKTMERERLRMNEVLMKPMKRVWRVALRVEKSLTPSAPAPPPSPPPPTDPSSTSSPAGAAAAADDSATTSQKKKKKRKLTHEVVMWARQPQLFSSDFITREAYVQFFARVFRCMHHPVNKAIDSRRFKAMPGKKLRPVRKGRKHFALDSGTRTLLEEDWENDSRGGVMHYGAFHDALFEVVDLWTSYEHVEAYVHFLNMLWVALTYDGIRVRKLSDVLAFNEVAYSKEEGLIRGPATRTQAMMPISLEGESNWFTVALPSTFFPSKAPEEVVAKDMADRVVKARPKRIFSAGIGRRRFVDKMGMPVFSQISMKGVQIILNKDMRSHMEDVFVMQRPGPRSALFIPNLHGGLYGEVDTTAAADAMSGPNVIDLGGWVVQQVEDGSRAAGGVTLERPAFPSYASRMAGLEALAATGSSGGGGGGDGGGGVVENASLIGHLDEESGRFVMTGSVEDADASMVPVYARTSDLQAAHSRPGTAEEPVTVPARPGTGLPPPKPKPFIAGGGFTTTGRPVASPPARRHVKPSTAEMDAHLAAAHKRLQIVGQQPRPAASADPLAPPAPGSVMMQSTVSSILSESSMEDQMFLSQFSSVGSAKHREFAAQVTGFYAADRGGDGGGGGETGRSRGGGGSGSGGAWLAETGQLDDGGDADPDVQSIAAVGSPLRRPTRRRRRKVKHKPEGEGGEVDLGATDGSLAVSTTGLPSDPSLPVLPSPIRVTTAAAPSTARGLGKSASAGVVGVEDPVLVSPTAQIRAHLRQLWSETFTGPTPQPSVGAWGSSLSSPSSPSHGHPFNNQSFTAPSAGGGGGGGGAPATSSPVTPKRNKNVRVHPLTVSPAAQKWTRPKKSHLWASHEPVVAAKLPSNRKLPSKGKWRG